MKIHSHRYLIEITEEKKTVDKFIVLVPYKGNETAVKAEKAIMKGANHYRTSKNKILLEATNYTLEYQETKLSDYLQSISIEKQGYAVIPFDIEFNETSKNEMID